MDKPKKPHGLIGTTKPQEVREKIAAAKRGVPRTEEAKAAISAGKAGKKRNPEDGKKISEGLRRYFTNKKAKA
ncbi:hypothetical protein [Ensifer sp. SL37]|uniref:hypothetical protein n=1 Tax=Ensifer sp. SL37 TaxID=2995137 RepID=UPI0022750B8D|nr:hypothetical protein [Ensifer sp. SL37]MCY1741459.1 hypothetical protein [Ensifer sp. SL37]